MNNLRLMQHLKNAKTGKRVVLAGRIIFVLELEQGKASVRLDKVLTLMAAVNLLALLVPLEEAMAALGPKR